MADFGTWAADAFREWRGHTGLSNESIAALLSNKCGRPVSATRVSHWATGDQPLPLVVIPVLCRLDPRNASHWQRTLEQALSIDEAPPAVNRHGTEETLTRAIGEVAQAITAMAGGLDGMDPAERGRILRECREARDQLDHVIDELVVPVVEVGVGRRP